MIQVLSALAAWLIASCYIAGFLHDAAYMEVFGIEHDELMGGPIEYLSTGALQVFSAAYLYVFIAAGFVWFGALCGVVFALPDFVSRMKFRLSQKKDVTAGLLLICFVLWLIIFSQIIEPSKESAKNDIKHSSLKPPDLLCLTPIAGECIPGMLLRYRDSKVIFFNPAEQQVLVLPEKKIHRVIHNADGAQ